MKYNQKEVISEKKNINNKYSQDILMILIHIKSNLYLTILKKEKKYNN